MALDLYTFPGLSSALADTPHSSVDQDEIADDVAAEQETLTSPTSDDSQDTTVTNDLTQLQDTLQHISKGISDSTESEYKR
jgi:hypothetical protein